MAVKKSLIALGGAALALAAFAVPALAQTAGGLPAFTSTPAGGGGTNYSLSLQTLLLLTSLTFLPAALLMMTGFTRIIIVLSLMRQALGTPASPPNQVLLGLSLFLTFFVMAPVLDRVYTEAYKPLSENKITMEEALDRGAIPLRTFMLRQTRDTDLALFVRLSNLPPPAKAEEISMKVRSGAAPRSSASSIVILFSCSGLYASA